VVVPGKQDAEATAVSKPTTGFWATHQAADPRAMRSIERLEKCKVTGPVLSKVRFPSELYPKQSVGREEGTVQIHLVFDSEWCVRKATILQSTGFWRLDNVSLTYIMTVKWMPQNPRVIDGEPTTDFRLGWGASQGKH
jgi:hypothetical protein